MVVRLIMGSVFVVQNQHRWDAGKQQFVPKFNLAPAEEYGELVDLLSPTASPFRPQSVLDEIREKLADYGDEDYLLLVGNPILLGLSVAIAAMANDGRINLLQWSGREQKYIAVEVDDVAL